MKKKPKFAEDDPFGLRNPNFNSEDIQKDKYYQGIPKLSFCYNRDILLDEEIMKPQLLSLGEREMGVMDFEELNEELCTY